MEACSLLVNLRKGMQSSSEQALVGEEHCMTTLTKAAKETTNHWITSRSFSMILIYRPGRRGTVILCEHSFLREQCMTHSTVTLRFDPLPGNLEKPHKT